MAIEIFGCSQCSWTTFKEYYDGDQNRFLCICPQCDQAMKILSGETNEPGTLRFTGDETAMVTEFVKDIVIPLNLNYYEADLVRSAIDGISGHYTKHDKQTLETVMHRLNDQMCEAQIKSIKTPKTKTTENPYASNPDFLEI